MPHVAAIAADREGVIYQGSAGPRAAGESDPVTADTTFRIRSMTKMPVTVAVLQQVEQGRLDLDAPVADYCPQFADVQVLTGLGYWLFSDLLVRWEQVTGVPNVVAGSSARSPPRCWPTRARRSSTASTSTGSAGSSRRSPAPGLDVEGITGPLGMSQTTFSMTGEQRPNCTPPGEAAPRWPR